MTNSGGSPPAPQPGTVSSKQPALLRAHEYAEKRDWPRYYQAVAGKGPRDTLMKALELFEKEDAAAASGAPVPAWRAALDLGCGEGRDTRELLRRSGPTRWHVMASDDSADGLALLEASLPPGGDERLLVNRGSMEEFASRHESGVPVGRSKQVVKELDLINVSYTLPFCGPAAFPGLWAWIVAHIKTGGRFAGQFFGERDDWARLADRTHHTRSEVDRLLAGFVIESMQEVENREAGVLGEIKNWHIFHIVARKRV